MVHFKRDGDLAVGKEEPYERGYRKDRYWKLGFYTDKTALELQEYLSEHGYQCPKNANKNQLMDAVGRCQRGLLSYGKFSAHELRGFCLARKVSLPPERFRMTVPRLTRTLEHADDKVDATFPRFMELPAELRNSIYELHFRDYDEISTEHDLPPITQVDQIGEESLPLFYKCVTFTWDLSLDTNFCIYEHTFTGDSYNLMNIPADDLAQIKNFKLHWTEVSRGAGGFTNRRVKFSAEISQLNNVKKMAMVIGIGVEPESQKVKDAMTLVLREIGYWDVNWKLERDHLIALQDAVNKVLRARMFGQ
jgi:hypothetical protein